MAAKMARPIQQDTFDVIFIIDVKQEPSQDMI